MDTPHWEMPDQRRGVGYSVSHTMANKPRPAVSARFVAVLAVATIVWLLLLAGLVVALVGCFRPSFSEAAVPTVLGEAHTGEPGIAAPLDLKHYLKPRR